jgi:hypothetical protein
VRTGDAKTGERDIKESGDHCRAYTKAVIIDFGNSMCKCSHVDINQLGNLELADWSGVECCYVFNEVGVDTQREIKSCSKD